LTSSSSSSSEGQAYARQKIVIISEIRNPELFCQTNFVNLVSLKRSWWKETQPGKLHALNQGSEISVHTAQYQHNKKASEWCPLIWCIKHTTFASHVFLSQKSNFKFRKRRRAYFQGQGGWDEHRLHSDEPHPALKRTYSRCLPQAPQDPYDPHFPSTKSCKFTLLCPPS
jgi:hypothetical protein